MKLWPSLLVFFIGVGVGMSAPMWTSHLRSYLPEFLRPQALVLEGEVTHKQREPERLLITVATPEGTVLATFQEKVMEMDLLIEQGDTVALEVPSYEPFVTDPPILRVVKETAAGEHPVAPSEKLPFSQGPEPPVRPSSPETPLSSQETK